MKFNGVRSSGGPREVPSPGDDTWFPGGGPLLEVKDLAIVTRAGGVAQPIVEDIAMTVSSGEVVGLVGESGSGKSLTARAIMGVLPAGVEATGSIAYRGRQLADMSDRDLHELRRSQVAIVFQDPFTMLNPLMVCGMQIGESLPRTLSAGARAADIERRLAEVGIADPGIAGRYPFQLSGGMRQRIGIAAALAGDPELLIADEITTALDVTTQRDVLVLLRRLQRSRGMGLVLITHNLRLAFTMCDRIYVLYGGRVLEVGPAAAVESAPLHPYTVSLLNAEPRIDLRLERLYATPGSVPRLDAVGNSCGFASRCQWRRDACTEVRPALVDLPGGRMSACLFSTELASQLRRASSPEPAQESAALPDEATVVVAGLRKEFRPLGRTGTTVVAIADASLIVGRQEIVALVGQSGSGKTTVARCIVGLETPTAGTIRIGDIDVSRYDRLEPGERRRARRMIQMVFQDPYSSLNPAFTVGKALDEAQRQAAGGERRTIAELLDLVGLPQAYAARRPLALSGGERQRVAIARALAVNPSVLVFDEPVSALDVTVQAQILNLILDLRARTGVSCLLISHDLAVVRQVADRTYVMLEGNIVEEGTTGNVIDHPQHAYTRQLIASVPTGEPGWLDTDLAQHAEWRT